MSDKDIHTLVPVKKLDSKDEGKAEAGKEASAVTSGESVSVGITPAVEDTEASVGGCGNQGSGDGGVDEEMEGKKEKFN